MTVALVVVVGLVVVVALWVGLGRASPLPLRGGVAGTLPAPTRPPRSSRASKHATSPVLSLLESRLRERVVVTLTSGEAFAGVLWEADDRVWVLRNAVAVGGAPDSSNLAVDGELVLLTSMVAFAQRP